LSTGTDGGGGWQGPCPPPNFLKKKKLLGGIFFFSKFFFFLKNYKIYDKNKILAYLAPTEIFFLAIGPCS
jgi:hypothetical protein